METDLFPIIQKKLNNHRITCCNRFKNLDFSIKPFVQNKLFNINVLIKKTLKNNLKNRRRILPSNVGQRRIVERRQVRRRRTNAVGLVRALGPSPDSQFNKRFFSFG